MKHKGAKGPTSAAAFSALCAIVEQSKLRETHVVEGAQILDEDWGEAAAFFLKGVVLDVLDDEEGDG